MQTVQPPQTPVRAAEVPLFLVFNLFQAIPYIEREKARTDSPYV